MAFTVAIKAAIATTMRGKKADIPQLAGRSRRTFTCGRWGYRG
jgi:hypothetical protein